MLIIVTPNISGEPQHIKEIDSDQPERAAGLVLVRGVADPSDRADVRLRRLGGRLGHAPAPVRVEVVLCISPPACVR